MPFIEDLLLKEKAKQEKNKKTFKSVFQWENADYIMIDEVGHLLRSDNLSTRFGQFLKAKGLKHIRFHDLRHSCASLMVANGVSIKQVQEWLGHANFNTTANIYTHLEYASKLQSAKTISNLLANDKTDTTKDNEKEISNQTVGKVDNKTDSKRRNKAVNEVEPNDKTGNEKDLQIQTHSEKGVLTENKTQIKIDKEQETKLGVIKKQERKLEINEEEYAEFLEWRKKKHDMEM